MDASAALRIASIDGAVSAAGAAALAPFAGAAGTSICVGSSAAVSASVSLDGQLARAQDGPVALPSSPSKNARQPGSTPFGSVRNFA